jgi:hypothetical protein
VSVDNEAHADDYPQVGTIHTPDKNWANPQFCRWMVALAKTAK